MTEPYVPVKEREPFKTVFGKELLRILEEDPKAVYLDADLMNCIGTSGWAYDHERAFNCGIAEANMIGIAAGLAAVGFKPYVHSFGPFASRRCFDQVFISAAYAQNPITVIGSDPGVTAALNGGTHMPFEDMAVYTAIPGTTVIDVTDCNMLRSLLPAMKERKGVKYLRFPRKNAFRIYEDGTQFEPGKAVELRSGGDVAIFAAGIMVNEALIAAETLAEEGINAAVYDVVSVKPLDRETILAAAKRCGCCVVAENHSRYGGLSSLVSEELALSCPVPVEYVAVQDCFGEVGPVDYLQERFGLTAGEITAKARRVIRRRKGENPEQDTEERC